MKKYGKGWFNESRRHSLARQGIKTGRKINKNSIDLGKINYAESPIYEYKLNDIFSNFNILNIEEKWNRRQYVVKVENPRKKHFQFDIYIVTFNIDGSLGSIIKVRDVTQSYSYSAHSGQPFKNTKYLTQKELDKLNINK